MNKITKKLSKMQGRKHYKLCTCDYGSLQCRLATIDTCLNPSGIDKALKSVYEPGGLSDLHCMTGFNTFVGSLHRNVIDAEDENGVIWTFLPEQSMKINRNGEEIVVSGKDIIETDSIVDYV